MIAEELELEESGQLTIGVAGEQRSLEGLAAPGKPAPITFERDHEPDEREAFDRETTRRIRHDAALADHEPDDELAHGSMYPELHKPSKRTYTCGVCSKTLKNERWIYSRHTGQRYCWPGECKADRTTKKEG